MGMKEDNETAEIQGMLAHDNMIIGGQTLERVPFFMATAAENVYNQQVKI